MNASDRRQTSLPPGLAGRLNPVCDSFEAQWLAGGTPRLEEFLPLVDEADRAALVRELLELERHYRRQRGEQPTPQEYRQRLPEYAGPVAAVFANGDAEPTTEALSGLQPAASLQTVSAANPSAQSQETQGTPRPEVPAAPGQPLPRLPGYEMLRPLGRGGMGVVYLGRHLRLNRLVAVKMVLAGEQAGEGELVRFLAEAEAVASLQHANVVAVFDFGQYQGLPYMVLEYVDGGNLHDGLRDHLPTTAEAAWLVEQLARGVAAAHANRIIHRDLKPQNILLRRKTPGDKNNGAAKSGLTFADIEPKITDFGLAKKVEGRSGLTQTGAIVGTPSYMAPEQAQGQKGIGTSADVYALGAILYECLTGRPPFRGSTPMETVMQVIAREPLAVHQMQPACPRDLETICHKCLRKEPAQRYGSAQALADDLQRFQQGEPIHARPVGRLERGRRWCGRNKALTTAFALTGLALLTIIVLLAAGADMSRRARDQAILHAEQETGLRRAAERESARMLLEQSLAKCRLEDAAVGLHWLGKSLQKAIDADAPDLEREARLQLALWSRELHQLEDVLPHADVVQAVAFSPDGKWLASRTFGGDVALWDGVTRRRVGELPGLGHTLFGLAFAPDSKRLAVSRTVNVDGNSAAQAVVVDVPGLRPVLPVLPHDGRVNDIVFSRDGKWIVTGSWDKTVRFWDAASGRPASVGPFVNDDFVEAIALSPDGTMLLTSTGTGTGARAIERWDTKSGQRLGKHVQEYGVAGLDFHPDGKTFLTGSFDMTARQWIAESGQPAGPIVRLPRGIWHARYHPDGRSFATASGDKTVRLWDCPTGRQVGPSLLHQAVVRFVAFRSDGRTLVSASSDRTARLWRLGGWAPVRTASLGLSNLGKVVRLPGSNTLAVAAAYRPGKNALVLWDMAAETERVFECPSGYFAIGNGDIAVLFTKQGPRLVQLPTGQELPWPIKETNLSAPVAMSSDDKLLAARMEDSVGLWEIANGRPLGEMLKHPKATCIAFSPDATRLLTGGLDKTARLWELPSGRLLHEWRHADKVQTAAFSPDGKLALTGGDDNAARLWDVATGRPAGAPLIHTGSVMAVAFSPDGRFIVTGNQSRHAALWDVASRRQLGPSLPHPESVLGVTFLKDGARFVTACYDGKRRIFDFPAALSEDPARIQAWIESITGQELTPDGSFRVLGADEWRERKKLQGE